MSATLWPVNDYKQQWIAGFFQGDPLPANAEVMRVLLTEDRAQYGSTVTRRYYTVLLQQRQDSGDGVRATAAIPMDDYEISNLKAGLETLRKLGLDTGDWLGELLYKLPDVEHRPPNQTVEQQLKSARIPRGEK